MLIAFVEDVMFVISGFIDQLAPIITQFNAIKTPIATPIHSKNLTWTLYRFII